MICEELSLRIESGSGYVEDVERGLLKEIVGKASKKENMVSIILGVVALIVSIVQFFV